MRSERAMTRARKPATVVKKPNVFCALTRELYMMVELRARRAAQEALVFGDVDLAPRACSAFSNIRRVSSMSAKVCGTSHHLRSGRGSEILWRDPVVMVDRCDVRPRLVPWYIATYVMEDHAQWNCDKIRQHSIRV